MRIVFTITNDIPFDQRMQKIGASLAKAGHQVLLIGKNRHSTVMLPDLPYTCRRLNTFFKAGKGFYIEYNIRLFFILLRSPADVFCAVDTDTLLANWLVARLRRKKLYFDAHEYFIELEEVVKRPITRQIWKWVEDLCIPSIDKMYTISEGYAALFKTRFHKPVAVVRNVAQLHEDFNAKTNAEKFILYQGAVNHGRGLEVLVEAMQWVNFPLVICGEGDVYESLKFLAKKHGVLSKITFTGHLTPSKLITYTQNAKIGITLFSNDGLSNHYSLCNRFFDYLHAGAPQLAMKYPEYEAFNEKYEVALLVEDLTPQGVAKSLQKLLGDDTLYQKLKSNALRARKEVCWQEEEKVLLNLFASA